MNLVQLHHNVNINLISSVIKYSLMEHEIKHIQMSLSSILCIL